MRLPFLMLPLVLGTLLVGGLTAQTPPGAEAAIRAAIAELAKSDLRTTDSIFFSGAYQRPLVRGDGAPEPTTRAGRVVPGSDRVTIRIRRIEVAASGDMAYEFSDGSIARRLKRANGGEEPTSFENSTLRAWKKVNGRWLVAAHSSAPHGDRP